MYADDRRAQSKVTRFRGGYFRHKKRSLAGAKAPVGGKREGRTFLVKKQSAGWAQPLVFLLIRIPGLRLASSNGIIGESLFFSHTAIPVDSVRNYLKKCLRDETCAVFAAVFPDLAAADEGVTSKARVHAFGNAICCATRASDIQFG